MHKQDTAIHAGRSDLRMAQGYYVMRVCPITERWEAGPYSSYSSAFLAMEACREDQPRRSFHITRF